MRSKLILLILLVTLNSKSKIYCQTNDTICITVEKAERIAKKIQKYNYLDSICIEQKQIIKELKKKQRKQKIFNATTGALGGAMAGAIIILLCID